MSKILVVDDDPHIRELIGVFLRAEGFDICEASDGVDALAKLVALKVDMVILDVMMPKMDGWDHGSQDLRSRCSRRKSHATPERD